MKRILRRGFPAETRRGSTLRLIDDEPIAVGTTIRLPIPSMWKNWVVLRRSSRYLWIEEAHEKGHAVIR